MREGLKWSDGEPYDAEDAAFYWDSVLQNEELVAVKAPVYLNSDESLMEFNVIDNFTIEFVADTSKPWFHGPAGIVLVGGQFLPPS